MTTEAAAAPTVTPAPLVTQGLILIKEITVREQVRKKFDENAHKELTESVRTKGVISPVTLRPKGGGFELVAGERRLRAAKAAGLTEIPAIVRELDDQAAALYQVEENIHRKDLTPIEEARGFKLLTQPVGTSKPKYTVEQLAKLVDKSAAYVYRALALLELPAKAVDAIEKGELTPAHGHQIMRVPPFEREKLLKEVLENGYDGRIMTAADLREHVDAAVGCRLDSAPFPKDKPFAGMIACAGCPSNSGNQGMLFDGAEKGRCMNRQCYGTKVKQHQADFLEKTTLAHLGAKFVEYGRGGQVYVGHFRTGGYTVKGEVGKSTKLNGEYGIIIDPHGYRVYYAARDRKEASASASPSTPSAAPSDPKAEFVEEAVKHAMYASAAAAAKKLKMEREDWVALAIEAANSLPNELWAAILGVPPDEGSDADFKKAPEATLRAIVLANSRLPRIDDAALKKIGVNVAAVRKEAAAEAEKGYIEFEASKGMEWPKNIAQIDKALHAALHATQGADKRWEKDKKTGLSDEELRNRLSYEWPESMGSSGAGADYSVVRAGFQFWTGTSMGKNSRREPVLKGMATVNRARIVLGIPYAWPAGGKV